MVRKKKRITIHDIVKARSRIPKEVQASKQEYDPNNVMPRKCATCPWRGDGQGVELGEFGYEALVYQVMHDSNQFCHAPALSGQPEERICRGARDLQLIVFHKLGVLKEPTDEAWREALE
jgi:hypothetical protein